MGINRGKILQISGIVNSQAILDTGSEEEYKPVISDYFYTPEMLSSPFLFGKSLNC